MSVPPDLVNRLAAMFTRLGNRGMTETMVVLGNTSTLDGSGTPVARTRTELGTITAYVATGGGSEQPAQEGNRAGDTHQFGFVPDGSGLLTEANYSARWLQFPARDGATYRITLLQTFGPYVWGIAERGGTADIAGGTK